MQQNTNKRQLGKEQETYAADFLIQKGYIILARNFQCRFGEIDLIARDGSTLVFAEVKYRSGRGSGFAEEAVTPAKQKKICRTADYYRVRYQISSDFPCRFDIIAISGTRVRQIENAFPYMGSGW